MGCSQIATGKNLPAFADSRVLFDFFVNRVLVAMGAELFQF